MIRPKIVFSLILAASLCLYSSCNKSQNPSTTTDTNYLYLTLMGNASSCPFTITVTGPTTFTDVVGTSYVRDSLIGINYVSGAYTFAFNGTSDGVTYNLSGAETITCTPLASTGCTGWSYAVKP